eukprot:CAMPEP_0196816008 /NCGR_PEP_ID=MMETSP1362-20130617/53068_1 /TAXON_ID=163516 /ORGANISM="Leptocylindrus danicus, Strain CCMP1856" /LENGTH=122 /DNA_ID=CAMNT_0042193185 /DNA_START=43 /DNA_END=411 /DNA_ORIENTATION=-
MFSAAARIALRSSVTPVARSTVTPVARLNFSRGFAGGTSFLDAGEVTERIVQVVKNFDKVDPAKVHASCKFVDDLGLDSLDTVEVVMAIEDEFAIEIPDVEADKIASITDATEYIAAHPMAK